MTDFVNRRTTHISGTNKVEKSKSLGYFVYFLLGFIEIFLVFRPLFKLTGANPGSGFVNFIYALTQLLVLPFGGIFHQTTTTGIETTAVFEPATLVAIVVYAVVAWGIAQLVIILSGREN